MQWQPITKQPVPGAHPSGLVDYPRLTTLEGGVAFLLTATVPAG